MDLRHSEIRALVKEKMNSVIENTPDSTLNSSIESGLDESSDFEARSAASDVMSDTSSKISMSRLSEVKDNIVQKATNVVVSKVMKSGMFFLLASL